MSSAVIEILKEALALDPTDRASLVEDLLSSLDQPDPHIERLWVEEVRERLANYKSGKIRAVPAEEVYAELGLL